MAKTSEKDRLYEMHLRAVIVATNQMRRRVSNADDLDLLEEVLRVQDEVVAAGMKKRAE